MNFYFRKEPWEQVPIEIIRNEISSSPITETIEVQKKRRDEQGNVVVVDGFPVYDNEQLDVTSFKSIGSDPTPEELEPFGYCVVKDCPEVVAQPWQEIVETFEVDQEGYYQRVLGLVDDLERAKSYKSRLISLSYEENKNLPVEIDGKFWKRSFESAQAIKALVDMVNHLGGTTCLLQPIDSEPVVKTLDEALTIAATIGQAYQEIYMKKESLLWAIKSSESVEEVLSVVWDEVE